MAINPEGAAGDIGSSPSRFDTLRDNSDRLSAEQLKQLSDAVKERSEEVSETGEMTVIEPFSGDGVTIDAEGWAQMYDAAWESDDPTTKDERFRRDVLDSIRKWNATDIDERSVFLEDGDQAFLGFTEDSELTKDDISRLTAARLIVGKRSDDKRTYERPVAPAGATPEESVKPAGLAPEKPVVPPFVEQAIAQPGNKAPERPADGDAAEDMIPSGGPEAPANGGAVEGVVPGNTPEAPAKNPEDMSEAEKQAEAERLYKLGDAAVRDPAFISFMTATAGRRDRLGRILDMKGNGAQNLQNMYLRATNPNVRSDENTKNGDERKKPLLAPYYEQFLRENGRENEIPVRETIPQGPDGSNGNGGIDGLPPSGSNPEGVENEETPAGIENEENDSDTPDKSNTPGGEGPKDGERPADGENAEDVIQLGKIERITNNPETREKAKSLKERFKSVIKRILPLALLALLINPMTAKKNADRVKVEAQTTSYSDEYVPPHTEVIPSDGTITVTEELKPGDPGYHEEMMSHLEIGDTISVPGGVQYYESSFGAAGHPGAEGERTGVTDKVEIRPAGQYTVDRATTWNADNINAGYANYADMYGESAGKKVADLGAEAGVENPESIIHIDGVNGSEVGGQTGWVSAGDLSEATIIGEDGQPETYTVEREVPAAPEVINVPGYVGRVENGTVEAAGEASVEDGKMMVEVDGENVEISFRNEDGSIVKPGDTVVGSDGNSYQITNVVNVAGETTPRLSILKLLHNAAVVGAAVGGTVLANRKREEGGAAETATS